MHDFAEEVANEHLKPEELRALLQRLALAEFGGPEEPRVRDIAEVAGMSPDAVGRILADLRGETFDAWRARFNETLNEHDRRIASLETEKSRPLDVDPVALYDLVQEGQRRKQRQNSKAFAIVLAAAIASWFIQSAVVNFQRERMPRSDQWAAPKHVVTVNGHYFGYEVNGKWSEADKVGKPGPITDEADSKAAKKSWVDWGNSGQ